MAKSKLVSNKPKAVKEKKIRLRRKKSTPEQIVIDRSNGLIFSSEDELYAYFKPQIDALEKQYQELLPENDVDVEDLEHELDLTLDQPVEIWFDDKTFKDIPVFCFIRPLDEADAFHVAATYVNSEDEPTFIFLHFVTREIKLIEKFRKGVLVYDKAFEEVGFAAIEGDSLGEGDPLAMGLFLSMLKLRSEKDIGYEKFQDLGTELREETIEEADEIWRSTDHRGNIMVTFIREYPDHEIKNLFYVAVTLEDPSSQVHTLMFSFPTNDDSLVDRYRYGENLQADEVVQESSH